MNIIPGLFNRGGKMVKYLVLVVSLLLLCNFGHAKNQFVIVDENILVQTHSDIANPHAGILLMKGEIYRTRLEDGKSQLIYADDISIVIHQNESITETYAPAELGDSSLATLILKQKISGKDQYIFDMSALDKTIKSVYFASYSQKEVELSREVPRSQVFDLDELFPQQYIRIVIPNYLTIMIEKNEVLHLPITYFSYDTNIYKAQYVSITGNRYLVDNDDYVILVDEKYEFVCRPPAGNIQISKNRILSVNHLGKGLITSLTSIRKKELYQRITIFSTITILLIGNIMLLFLLRNMKMRARARRDNIPSSTELYLPQLKELIQRLEIVNQKLESNSQTMPSPELEPQRQITTGDKFSADILSMMELEGSSRAGQNKPSKNNMLDQVSSSNVSDSTDSTTLPTRNDVEKGAINLKPDIALNSDHILSVASGDQLVHRHFKVLEFIMAVQVEIVNLLEDWQKYSASDSEYYMLNLIVGNYLVKSNPSHLSKWLSVIESIDEKGLILDSELIRNLRNTAKGDVNLANLEKIMYYELYSIIISPFCIMLEELRNFKKFADTESIFTKKNEDIGNRGNQFQELVLENIGISIHYVPLFTHYAQYKNITAIEGIDGFIYKMLSVQKDMISQIISYGLKSVWGDSPTEVRISR